MQVGGPHRPGDDESHKGYDHRDGQSGERFDGGDHDRGGDGRRRPCHQDKGGALEIRRMRQGRPGGHAISSVAEAAAS